MAAVDVLQIRHVHPVGERMEQRHGHMPTVSGLLAPEQGLQDALERRHAGGDVATDTPTRAGPAALPVTDDSPLSAWTSRS